MNRTEYARVTFTRSLRIFSGLQPRSGIDAKDGIRLFRETDGVRDDLVIEVSDSRVPWDVPWKNIASAQRLAPPPAPTRTARAAKAAES